MRFVKRSTDTVFDVRQQLRDLLTMAFTEEDLGKGIVNVRVSPAALRDFLDGLIEVATHRPPPPGRL